MKTRPALGTVAADLASLLFLDFAVSFHQDHWIQWENSRKAEWDFIFICSSGHLPCCLLNCKLCQFMACIAICSSRKGTPTLNCTTAHPVSAPLAFAVLLLGAMPTTPVWRKGDAPVSLTHVHLWITGNCLGSWSDIQSCPWAMCSVTQILCAKPDRTGSSLDICHVHLPLAAPFPCTAGGPGVHKKEGTFWQKLQSQSFDFLSSKEKQASPETSKGSGKYVHFPISSCLNIKTQLTKPASRYLSQLQILPPKVNLYILMGMAVSFPPSLCLFTFWLFTHWTPVLKSINFFLSEAFRSAPRIVHSQENKLEIHSLF